MRSTYTLLIVFFFTFFIPVIGKGQQATFQITSSGNKSMIKQFYSSCQVNAAELEAFTFSAPRFAGLQGEKVSYQATSADGSLLPQWIEYFPYDHSFKGMPVMGDRGMYQFMLMGTDGKKEVYCHFTVLVKAE